jgi:hypothetical protein
MLRTRSFQRGYEQHERVKVDGEKASKPHRVTKAGRTHQPVQTGMQNPNPSAELRSNHTAGHCTVPGSTLNSCYAACGSESTTFVPGKLFWNSIVPSS